MKVLETKNARFTEIVQTCGAPQVYTLWQKPKSDRNFQTQLKNNRIMTILPSATGSDFGLVGWREKKGARLLAFPKSLRRYIDRRIIGIKWELVRE